MCDVRPFYVNAQKLITHPLEVQILIVIVIIIIGSPPRISSRRRKKVVRFYSVHEI